MKNIIIRSMTLCLAIGICLSSCNKGPMPPEKVALKAFSALQKKDYQEYLSYFDLSKEEQEMMAVIIKYEDDFSEWTENVKSYEIIDVKIKEDTAFLTERIIYKDGKEETNKFRAIKDEGIFMVGYSAR